MGTESCTTVIIYVTHIIEKVKYALYVIFKYNEANGA